MYKYYLRNITAEGQVSQLSPCICTAAFWNNRGNPKCPESRLASFGGGSLTCYHEVSGIPYVSFYLLRKWRMD